MATLRMLCVVASTYILIFANFANRNISEVVRAYEKLLKYDFYRGCYFLSNETAAIMTLVYIFKVRLLKWRLMWQGCKSANSYYCHQTERQVYAIQWPRHDYDLHFQGNELRNVNISKRCELAGIAQTWLLQMLIFAIEGDHSECCATWPWPKFSVSNLKR